MDVVRFARSARKHRIGRAHALHVLRTVEPSIVPEPGKDDRHVWIGHDDRGVELEIIGIQRPDCMLIIHVMPAHYRA